MRWLVLVLFLLLWVATMLFGGEFLSLPMVCRISIATFGVVGLAALTWWASR